VVREWRIVFEEIPRIVERGLRVGERLMAYMVGGGGGKAHLCFMRDEMRKERMRSGT